MFEIKNAFYFCIATFMTGMTFDVRTFAKHPFRQLYLFLDRPHTNRHRFFNAENEKWCKIIYLKQIIFFNKIPVQHAGVKWHNVCSVFFIQLTLVDKVHSYAAQAFEFEHQSWSIHSMNSLNFWDLFQCRRACQQSPNEHFGYHPIYKPEGREKFTLNRMQMNEKKICFWKLKNPAVRTNTLTIVDFPSSAPLRSVAFTSNP